jgi:hypothetical protein
MSLVTTDRERDFCPKYRALTQQNGFIITEKPAAARLGER